MGGFVSWFFFFQAEDGIRDDLVTGVQTCALPISIVAYDRVLELAPSHPGALDALATLRAVVGDAENALAAIEELSEKATTPAAKAELEVRAAQVLEARADAAGAMRRYKLPPDLRP